MGKQIRPYDTKYENSKLKNTLKQGPAIFSNMMTFSWFFIENCAKLEHVDTI